MSRKRRESFFKVGSMYQWLPNRESLYDGEGFRVYLYKREHGLFDSRYLIQPEEIIFISEVGKYDKCIDYCKILTRNGDIGYIYVDDSFLCHWKKVTS
jgi:hypothetical protein